jgi:D-alanine-D-alanine ligase-like ATP-grasp enzyme
MVATALKASAVLGLPVAGIDMMLTKPVAEADPGDGVIIEVNKGPSLYIHDHPTAGINRGATAAYVNYLEML